VKTADMVESGDHAALAQRKAFVIMQVIKEPGRFESAVGSLWSSCLAVLATLSLQFAQVAALALGMAETVKPLVTTTFQPMLDYSLDPKIAHWTGSIINVTLNFLAIWIAWTLMAVVAAVYSGLRGGRMFADALFGLVADYGLLEYVPEVARPWLNTETSLIDEGVMYLLAGIGIYSQLAYGFAIFFPLNIVLAPLTFIEWFLRIQIATSG